MIENLNGIHETVNYKDNTNIRLYDNKEFEEYPNHWHTAIEIIMPTENPYQVDYESFSHTLKEQELIFLCPGVLHHMPAIHGKRYIFQAELSNLSSVRELDSVLSLLSPALVITPDTCPDIYGELHRHMLEIVEEYHSSSLLYEATIYARLLEMLTIIGRSGRSLHAPFSTSYTKQREYMDKFMSICDFISEHCTESLTLDMVADLCGFSKYHFTRLFKQFTNVSFYKFLNQKRIAKAQELLVDPSISITDVSFSCGFSSLSAFIRMFKIIKGCTPSEFRDMYTPRSSGAHTEHTEETG
ncbi:MAG: AraC family transcriptional regulator [Eubacteriales bacterium]|nr:AraC family transcriptional regulator [Eubacteriales bacterium]